MNIDYDRLLCNVHIECGSVVVFQLYMSTFNLFITIILNIVVSIQKYEYKHHDDTKALNMIIVILAFNK